MSSTLMLTKLVFNEGRASWNQEGPKASGQSQNLGLEWVSRQRGLGSASIRDNHSVKETHLLTSLPSFKEILGKKKKAVDNCCYSSSLSDVVFIRGWWNPAADSSCVLVSDIASKRLFWACGLNGGPNVMQPEYQGRGCSTFYPAPYFVPSITLMLRL